MNELTFEQVKAQYFDENALEEASEPLFRIDGGGHRYYYHLISNKPQFYISVTSLIDATLPKGFGFNQWLKNGTAQETDYRRDSRAAYGTLMHIEIGYYIIDGTYDLNAVDELVEDYARQQGYPELATGWKKELAKDIMAFAAFVDERNVEPLVVEIGLASPQMGIAGCIDLVCELDFNGERKRAIVDMKSGGIWPSHDVQLEAYRRLWGEQYPNKPIDMLFNWTSKDWRKKPSYTLKNQTDRPDKLDHLISLWNVDNPENCPPDVLSYQGEITRGEDWSNCYKVESVEDMIKKENEVFA